MLPQRPPLLRGSSSEMLRTHKSGSNTAVQRRISFQRQSSFTMQNGGVGGPNSSGVTMTSIHPAATTSSYRRFVRQSSASDVMHSANHAAAATRVLPNPRTVRRYYADQSEAEKQSMMALIAGAQPTTAASAAGGSDRHAHSNGDVSGAAKHNNIQPNNSTYGCDRTVDRQASNTNLYHWSKRPPGGGYQRLESTTSSANADSGGGGRQRRSLLYRQTSMQD